MLLLYVREQSKECMYINFIYDVNKKIINSLQRIWFPTTRKLNSISVDKKDMFNINYMNAEFITLIALIINYLSMYHSCSC